MDIYRYIENMTKKKKRKKEERKHSAEREREKRNQRRKGFAAIYLANFQLFCSGKHVSSRIKIVLGLEGSMLI
jgi:hypothetical protein